MEITSLTPEWYWTPSGYRPLPVLDAQAKIEVLASLRHLERAFGSVYLEKKTRACPICSWGVLSVLLSEKLIRTEKDPKLFYSRMDGTRVHWKVRLALTEKGIAELDRA